MQPLLQATIDNLSHDGRGVARIDGKTTFISDALPGEKVLFRYIRKRKSYDEGQADEIILAANERVQPKCAHATLCSSCNLQHLSPSSQINAKQQKLLEQLKHIADLEPDTLLDPVTGPVWGYRRKARLGVRFVAKKNDVLLGFREKHAPRFLTDIAKCEVLHPSAGQHMHALKDLVASLDAYQEIPQIEVAVGDEITALIFRHLGTLTTSDREKLCTFARHYHLQIYLQTGGIDTIQLIYPLTDPQLLSYHLPEYNISLRFYPTDFIQVNREVNNKLIKRVINLLDLNKDDNVLDLFCGIGNFTLPVAKYCQKITGIEGEQRMVIRAQQNAQLNNIQNCELYGTDLQQDFSTASWLRQSFNKVLLDPPRSGAINVIRHLSQIQAARIVYVSCDPATLARDAKILVQQQNYRLACAGIVDMFPHTRHIESIAVFNNLNFG